MNSNVTGSLMVPSHYLHILQGRVANMISSKIVESLEVEVLNCDNCGIEMVQENYALTSYPPQYVYKCPMCNSQHITTELFPRIAYNLTDASSHIRKTFTYKINTQDLF